MYDAIASDYDGTIAYDGTVSAKALAALEEAKRVGFVLLLVTGRELDDLFRTFADVTLFDAVVAENGALLYEPRPFPRERALAPAPPIELVTALRARGVPLALGRIVVATEMEYEDVVAETIEALGLDLQILANKSSLMVLPRGVDKGSGLRAALSTLGISPARVVAIGDAENDVALLDACGLRIAVADALPALKEHAHIVLEDDDGASFIDSMARLRETNSPWRDRRPRRRRPAAAP